MNFDRKTTTNIAIQLRATTLPTVSEQEFLPPIGRWMTLSGVAAIAMAGLTLPLMSQIEYKIAVAGQATIRPAGELRIVQSATAGRLTELRVRENQQVKRGEVLAILDSSLLLTSKVQTEDTISQLKLQLRQIQAQITAQDNRLIAESDRLNRTLAAANAELNYRQRAYQNLQITTDAELAEAEANLQSVVSELRQAETDLISVTAERQSSQAELAAAVAKRDRYQTVANSGALSAEQLQEAKLAVVQLQQGLRGKRAIIRRQQQEIRRRTQAVAAAQARVTKSKAAIEPHNGEVAIARSNIQREQAAHRATTANLQQERQALIQQGIELQDRLLLKQSELKQIKKDLEQTRIRATATGTVFQLNLRNIGQTLSAGDKVAQIAPNNSSFILKSQVAATEIGKIAIGQTVQTKISACPYPDYGTLRGEVTKISPDAIAASAKVVSNSTQPAINNNKNTPGTYEVTIAPEANILQRDRHQCQLQLGMEGRSDIITEEETVLRFLLRKAKLLTDL